MMTVMVVITETVMMVKITVITAIVTINAIDSDKMNTHIY